MLVWPCASNRGRSESPETQITVTSAQLETATGKRAKDAPAPPPETRKASDSYPRA